MSIDVYVWWHRDGIAWLRQWKGQLILCPTYCVILSPLYACTQFFLRWQSLPGTLRSSFGGWGHFSCHRGNRGHSVLFNFRYDSQVSFTVGSSREQLSHLKKHFLCQVQREQRQRLLFLVDRIGEEVKVLYWVRDRGAFSINRFWLTTKLGWTMMSKRMSRVCREAVKVARG